jgi:hypothetical protein
MTSMESLRVNEGLFESRSGRGTSEGQHSEGGYVWEVKLVVVV